VSRTRAIALVLVAACVVAVCVRLGIWQLDRLAERRAMNARTAASFDAEPTDITAILDRPAPQFRRVTIRGSYDFDSEIVLVNRSRDGAPGVNLLTPLRVPGHDTAVLVNRGWVYSPDGASVDRVRWREAADMAGTAYVLQPTFAPSATTGRGPLDSTRRLLRVDTVRIAASIPYPVASYQLVLLAGGTPGESLGTYATGAASEGSTPVRLPPPALDEGPHKSYAIQWFSFATIVIVGTGALLWNERTRARIKRNGRFSARPGPP
jgi:surfeit locus 1 family protein